MLHVAESAALLLVAESTGWMDAWMDGLLGFHFYFKMYRF